MRRKVLFCANCGKRAISSKYYCAFCKPKLDKILGTDADARLDQTIKTAARLHKERHL